MSSTSSLDGSFGRRNSTGSNQLFQSAQEFPAAAAAPPPPSITTADLDVEDAEGDVFQAVEDIHKKAGGGRGGGPSLLLTGSRSREEKEKEDDTEAKLYDAIVTSVSQNSEGKDGGRAGGNNIGPTNDSGGISPSLRLKEAANRIRRMTIIKNVMTSNKNKHHNRRRSSMSSARNLLLGIQEDEETEAILNDHLHNNQDKNNHSSHNDSEKDGIMKEDDFKLNPYAGEFDHHLLMASSSSTDSEEDNRQQQQGGTSLGTRSEEQTLLEGVSRASLFFRSSSAPINKICREQQQSSTISSLPLHHHHHASSDHFIAATNNNNNNNTTTTQQQQHPKRRFSASDYIATTTDGFLQSPCESSNSTTASTTNLQRPRRRNASILKEYKKKHWFPRVIREICAMCHPYRLSHNCYEILERSYFLWFGFPCLLLSCCLFYLLGNPYWDFLPGNASVAWWLLFATRQTVTLGLARLTIYVLVDGFMLGTRLAVQTLGPLLTLIAATSKGWPLILSAWGMWNLLLLHGATHFKRNWLYWTQIDFFNQHYDGRMMNSSLYTRILVSAILGGLAVSAKRTIMALRFGRKQFRDFKPRLERILADVVLLSEIATLAEEVDQVEQETELEPTSSWDLVSSTRNANKKKDLKEYLLTPDVAASASAGSNSISNTTSGTTDISSSSPEKSKRNTTFANSTMGEYGKAYTSPKISLRDSTAYASPRCLKKTESGRFKIKDMLDSWEEPEGKGDKGDDISIHDILRFRRALSHLDEDNLFGEAFGCTKSRDETIASSHSVYYRLVKLAPPTESSFKTADSFNTTDSSTALPFDVLALITLQEDGHTENTAKKRMIRKIFTPDRSGALPLLAFVQAVDKIYKRLRYFRASIRNASVIDSVLERVVNAVFYCVLAFMLSSLMQLNPWTLMVSITSLLVSVSFALGSSISHYVEGVLLIAVRRPYDLGDRIFMASAESINPMPDVSDNSWFVEDITLSTTTLRYTRTNEVSTVNNWSIAGSRIVNCARSPRATVHMEFTAHTSILEQRKLQTFQSEIKRYVEEHPRLWESVAHIRHDKFNADDERIDFTIALRHRNSWQEAGRIRLDRSNFYRFLFELGNKLDVHFASPPDQRISYIGGKLKRGDDDDCYMRDLVRGANMIPNQPQSN